MKIYEKRVTIDSLDGIKIPGIYCAPNGKNRGAILVLHGITTHKDEYGNFFADLARAFALKGLASLRIDFRGHGESTVSQKSFTVASQLCDTVAASRWLRTKAGVQRIAILGCSFGCPPAIFAVEVLPNEIGKLVLICPVLDYERTFLRPETLWAKEQFSALARKSWMKRGYLMINGTFSADVKLLCELHSLEPAERLKRSRMPCLIIHGTADSMVPFAAAEALVNNRRGTEHLFVKYMDHGYGDADDETGVNPKSLRNFATIRDRIQEFMNIR